MGKEKINYPFIYIASLMRTGSTVVQEALTEPPLSFIFHEPQLGRNKFNIKDRFLKDLPINVKKILRPPSVEVFAKKVIPKLKNKIVQVGVKEIEHNGWRNYLKYFPDIKFILTSRDPRDIYISIHYWFVRKGTNKWKNGKVLNPKVLFDGLNKDFLMQKEMFKTGKAIRVKYEDFCQHPNTTIFGMKEFVNSPIQDVGEVGGFLSNNPKRIGEYKIHGNEVTDSRVCRWKKEGDKKLIEKANNFYNFMEDYCDFWGY